MKLHLKINAKYASVAILLSAISLFSCTKENKKDTPAGTSGIYATYSSGGQYLNRKAVLWRDGVESDFTNYNTLLNSHTSTSIYTGAVAVSPKGDVYVSGCECLKGNHLGAPDELSESCFTILWKNGVKQYLNKEAVDRWYMKYDDTNLGINDNGDVYVLGKDGSPSSGKYSVWKNGSRIIELKDADNVSDMFVKGNDVYIIGMEGLVPGIPRLWKNGIAQPLPGTGSSATSVYVTANNDIYLGMNDGKLFKNNTEQMLALPAGSKAVRIAGISVVGSDVYVLGKIANANSDKAVIWKNGVQLYELNYSRSINYHYLYALYVSGGDIYATSTVTYDYSQNAQEGTNVAVIWKNGEVYKDLIVLKNDRGILDVPSIFVK